MKQLSGLDAAFIHQETSRTPMHVCPVLVYAPDEAGRNLDLQQLESGFANCLAQSPILTRKLRSLPMGLDEPYWVKDNRFELGRHLNELQLPDPGNWQRLKKLLAQLHGTGLNLKEPLWQAYLISGLDRVRGFPPGSCALMIKIHHAAIDGVSLAKLVSSLHDQSMESEPVATGDAEDPDQIEMWSRANLKHWTRPLKLANTVGRLIPAFGKLRDIEEPADLTSKTQHSKTRFNAEVTRGRVIGSIAMATVDMKAIRRGVRRVTLNDIAVSIVGGALREYLQFHDELPDSSLVCGAPVNLRGKGDGSAGNKIATMQIGMATDIIDPVERVRTVHQYALIGKAKINTLGSGTIMDISDSVAPGVLAEGLRALSFASTRVSEMPVPFHVMISNVPGPTEPMCLCGHELLGLIGLGPIRHAMGLFHVVSNSASNYSITFTSCRSIMPDPEFYEKCLQRNFDALLAAACR